MIREDEGGLTLDILVSPRASRPRVGPVVGNRIKVAVTAPPVDGEANAEVVELLARALGVRKTQVAIVAGHKGKRKTVRVEGAHRRRLDALLEDAS